ncbi:family 3 glycoside hydrolase [Sistotremastrum suecicum HHB10207 ss-3]|uniref:Family 3 glycoside hydrolase n=1 Tax=Sistotremastrum suecicum HHB10207 ss-3 TaxID=1314776 RepID=A0A166C5F6_9AGAM|nr:family 3 glycoside hydrolase [Sistotremastrum suecicum HHB10207 ss-3]
MLKSTIVSILAASAFTIGIYASDTGVVTSRSVPANAIYKNPKAAIEDRVNDLLPRMTIQEKVAQIIQGDMNGWMDFSNPLDDTLTYNASGLANMMATRSGSIWGGYLVPWQKFVYGVTIGQKYLMENTTLGIPAIIQSEGLHGFTNNGTTWPSPIGLSASFNAPLLQSAAKTMADEAEGLGVSQMFAPVLDLSRELRWGRVEENYGEDPFLTSQMGLAYVTGLQNGSRRNTSSTATARMAATCKHFAAFGSPQGGLNIAQVSGGERELQTYYLRPFNKACVQALSIMTAYSSYDGIPAIANTHLLTDILRNEWGYKYWATTDAGSVDLLISLHGTCDTRECAAKTSIQNIQGEMGGGSYTYETLADQVAAGTVNETFIDETVKTMLRTKFTLGLFENPYPYSDYLSTLRTPATRTLLHQMEQEAVVLLQNRNNVLPLSSKSVKSIAVLGPQANRVTFGDYVFFNASNNGITPLNGFKQLLSGTKVKINFAEGCKLWSNDQSEIAAAVQAAKSSDVAIVMVGTWSLDQTLLWTPGTNATTGEHVDLSDLKLVGAQLDLVQAVQAVGKPTIVVFVSGKPVAEPWIAEHADAVIQQFYPGELGGLAIAEVIFGVANPSGRLPVSFPRSVGTTPVFYNYLKGSRPLDPGSITDNGTLMFGHQYVLDSPVPLWSFGEGLSYTTFKYTNLKLSKTTIGTGDSFSVSVTVQNTGKLDGKEVVQVYLTDIISSAVTPNQHLAGFQKVLIKAGASTSVTIPIDNSDLGLWTTGNTWAVEPGQFNVAVGTSATVYLNTTLTVH